MRDKYRNSSEVWEIDLFERHFRGRGFPGGLNGKKPSAMQETWVQHLDWEVHLEKGIVILSSSCLENPWAEEPDGLQSIGSQGVRHC